MFLTFVPCSFFFWHFQKTDFWMPFIRVSVATLIFRFVPSSFRHKFFCMDHFFADLSKSESCTFYWLISITYMLVSYRIDKINKKFFYHWGKEALEKVTLNNCLWFDCLWFEFFRISDRASTYVWKIMKEEIIHEENQIFENFFIYLALYAFLDLSKLLCQSIDRRDTRKY